jgi:hypothetical protein
MSPRHCRGHGDTVRRDERGPEQAVGRDAGIEVWVSKVGSTDPPYMSTQTKPNAAW